VATFVFAVYLTSKRGWAIPRYHARQFGWAARGHRRIDRRGAGAVVGVWWSPRVVGAGAELGDGPGSGADLRHVLHPRSPELLLGGLVLLGVTAAFCDLASVPYNAMLRQLSTAADGRPHFRPGRGVGLPRQRPAAATDLCGIHFRLGSGPDAVRGLLRCPLRRTLRPVAMLVAARGWRCWLCRCCFATNRLPSRASILRAGAADQRAGWLPQAVDEISAEWRARRNLVYFLGASALFRDGSRDLRFGAVLVSASTASRRRTY